MPDVFLRIIRYAAVADFAVLLKSGVRFLTTGNSVMSTPIRQLTARFWSTQKRSRSIRFSILPEPLFGRSVSDSSMRRGIL